MDRIYLDNAATTPLDPEVIKEMTLWMKEYYGNPSSIHAEGRKVRAGIEEARKQVANYLNASIGEIFFTSCGTESNNMALKCSVRDLGVDRIISSPIEHHCILHTLDHLKKNSQVEIEMLNVNAQGQVDLTQLEELLKNSGHKTMVSLMHANNELGTLLPFEKVSAMCLEHNAYFHSDTVQTVAHFPFDVQATPISFMSGSAHKFHGPKGVGFIYINSDNNIDPFIDGGGQERNMRAGTENVYGIRGLSKALTMAVDEMKERTAFIKGLRNYLKKQLITTIPGIKFLGDQENYLYTVLSCNFPKHPKNELLLLNLDLEGISASGGSACTSGAESASHVLYEVQADPTTKTIRFSFSHFNTTQHLDTLMEKLIKILDLVAA